MEFTLFFVCSSKLDSNMHGGNIYTWLVFLKFLMWLFLVLKAE